MKKILISALVSLFLLSSFTPSFALDDYPDYLKKKPIDEVVDPWNFYNRECTSFVAWALNSRNGLSFQNYYKGEQFGNAADWAPAARKVGIQVDKTPQVGSVAWWGQGYGHVSYVVDISSQGVRVEEYNAFRPGEYGERTIPISRVEQFIHFGGTDDFMKNRISWAKNVAYKRDDYFKGSYTGRMKLDKPMGEGYILFDADSGILKELGAISYKGGFEDGYPQGEGSMEFEDRVESGTYYGAPEPGKTVFEGSAHYHSGNLSGFMHRYKLRVKAHHKLEYYDEEWYRYYERVDLTSEEAEAMKKDKSLVEKKFPEDDYYGRGSEEENWPEGEENSKNGIGEDEPKQQDENKIQTEEAVVNEMGFTKSSSYELGQFSDVLATDWFEPWVARASEYGLVKGSNGSFSPMGYITYAEIITIAARIHSIYYDEEIADYGWGEWYDKYYEYALRKGMIDSIDRSLLKERINRSESVGILGRALPQKALASKNRVEDSAIPDVKMNDANSSPIYIFYRAGILSGSDAQGRFHPLKYITRAEISKIIVCMVEENSRKSFELLGGAY